MTDTTHAADQQNMPQGQFVIQRVYVKNLSLETKDTPAVFQQRWEPELSLNINTEHQKLDEHVYEVNLTVTATVSNQKTTAFLIEIQQAGIFTIDGAPQEQLDHLLNSFCPSILFPYAREAISSESVRASFPQLVLSPINFDALYMQQLAEKQKDTTATQ